MTIDTKELRRLAQAASHPTTKGRWIRLFGERTVYDRMEDGCRGIPVVSTDKHPPSSFEAACLDFIAAANPAVINSLLERLEAAESDALEQARLNGMGSEREAKHLAQIAALEKERDALRDEIACVKEVEFPRKAQAVADAWKGKCKRLEAERDALRAKIEAMEKQEPVGQFIQHPSNGLWEQDGYGDNPEASPLYALPGAQPVPARRVRKS